MKQLNKNIVEIRNSLNVNQSQFSKLLGITRGNVNKIEAAASDGAPDFKVSEHVAEMISRRFGVNLFTWPADVSGDRKRPASEEIEIMAPRPRRQDSLPRRDGEGDDEYRRRKFQRLSNQERTVPGAFQRAIPRPRAEIHLMTTGIPVEDDELDLYHCLLACLFSALESASGLLQIRGTFGVEVPPRAPWPTGLSGARVLEQQLLVRLGGMRGAEVVPKRFGFAPSDQDVLVLPKGECGRRGLGLDLQGLRVWDIERDLLEGEEAGDLFHDTSDLPTSPKPPFPHGTMVGLRALLALNQVEFARVLGISSGHLSKVEAGVAPVSEDLVAMIRRRCNVQVSAGTATGSQSSPPADLVPILKAIDQRRPLGAVDKSNHYLAKMGEIQLTTLEDRLDEDVWELFLHTLNVVRRVVSTHFAFLHRLEVTLTSVLPETVATQRERFAVAEVEHALMSALEKSPDVSVEESQQSEGGGEIAVVSTANPNIRLAIGLEDLHVWGAAKRKKSELSQ